MKSSKSKRLLHTHTQQMVWAHRNTWSPKRWPLNFAVGKCPEGKRGDLQNMAMDAKGKLGGREEREREVVVVS